MPTRRSSAGRTRPGIPPGRVGLFPEVRARDEWLGQVLGILDDGGDGEPDVAAAFREEIVVLADGGAGAVRHTVLPEVAWPQVRGDDFERASAGAFARIERDREEVGRP